MITGVLEARGLALAAILAAGVADFSHLMAEDEGTPVPRGTSP